MLERVPDITNHSYIFVTQSFAEMKGLKISWKRKLMTLCDIIYAQ